ncbi:MAG: glutathione S-transferase family protein [Pseudomonadota bacterium]
MNKLTLYGGAKSRAIRSLWALEECCAETGIDYHQVKLNTIEEMRSPDFLAVNPNGKIPALKHDDLFVFESMCINLHVAKRFAPKLYPLGDWQESLVLQWSFWAISEIEPLQMDLLNNTKFLPKNKRLPEVANLAIRRLNRPLETLEKHLTGRQWLLTDNFSIADLNLASVMLLLDMAKYDFTSFPRIAEWRSRCYGRPAFGTAQQR